MPVSLTQQYFVENSSSNTQSLAFAFRRVEADCVNCKETLANLTQRRMKICVRNYAEGLRGILIVKSGRQLGIF